jgi:hypothetical protein
MCGFLQKKLPQVIVVFIVVTVNAYLLMVYINDEAARLQRVLLLRLPNTLEIGVLQALVYAGSKEGVENKHLV